MFDSSFLFTYKNHAKGDPRDVYLKRVHTYVFHTPQPYIFRAEEYDHNLFAIKYYPKQYQDSKERFNILTGENKAQPIIRTCLDIMLDLLERYEMASFGFYGATLLGEGSFETKRFRVYQRVIENFFSPLRFSHHQFPELSCYLLLNRKEGDPEHLQKIEAMVKEVFEIEEKD